METMTTRDYLELWWLRVDADYGIRAAYELSNGADVLGTLKWRGWPKFCPIIGVDMTAATGDGAWTFRWTTRQCAEICQAETGEEIARFTSRLWREGLLEVYSGDRFIWDKRHRWRSEWGWFMDEKALVYLERCSGFVLPTQINVAIMPLGRDASDLALLVTLGLFLILDRNDDSDF